MTLTVTDVERRQRTLRRYRFMFKATLAEFAISILMIVIGAALAISSSENWVLGIALLLLAATFFNGWKILNSTVKLLEVEARETGWPQFS